MPHSKTRTAATLDRRGFLKAGVAATIGSAVAASGVVATGSTLSVSAAEAREENRNRATAIPSRVIGLADLSAWFLFAIVVTGNAAEVRSSGSVDGGANEIIAPGWERSYQAG